MNSLHDLFLLMFTLSQMSDRDKIMELFHESISELFKPVQFVYSEEKVINSVYYEEISTRNYSYGYISSGVDPPKETKSLLQNAIQMLAVILDRLTFENELKKRADSLETITKKQLNEIANYVDELETARLASLNLIEDLKDEITERKKAQQELQETEEKFRLAFQTSPDSININRLSDGLYIEINSGFTGVTGYTKKDVIGKSSVEINIWSNPEDRQKLVSQLQKQGVVKNLEATFRKKNGSLVVGLMSASVIQLNNETHIISITRDISKIRATQDKLRTSEVRFRNAFENSAVGMCLTSISGKFLQVNKKLCQILAYSNEELLKTTFQQITHPEDIAISTNHIAEAIKLKSDQLHFEKRYLRKNGEIIWAEISSSLFRDENGDPIYFVTHIVDITDRKTAEEEIKKLNETLEKRVMDRTIKLEAVNKELEAFTYSVSHDLKAPLRGIDGYSKLLLELFPKDLNQEAKMFLTNIRAGTLQMNQLIEDLLSYSRLERTTMRDSAIDIKVVIDDIISNYREEIDVREIKIIIDVKKTIIVTDYNGLVMALRNLIENAIKFTRKIQNPIISISFIQTKTYWEVIVKDNGIGFKMAYHDKIFEIFHRLHHVEDFPGTGIGLALVSKAIKRMGGSVRAESKLDSGATFFLKIPQK